MPSLVVGLLLAWFDRRQRIRDDEHEKSAAAHRRELLLSIELSMATAKMSYAVAMALKRGETNGEVEEGIAAYMKAKHAYTAFLNEQAGNHLIH